jgi:hypothetical protein
MKTSYPKLHRVIWKHKLNGQPPKPRGEVVVLDVVTKQDLDPDRVLKGAIGELQDVVVIGWDKSGDLWLASNTPYQPDLLWLVKQAEKELFKESEQAEYEDLP